MPRGNVTVRPARLADLPALAGLTGELRASVAGKSAGYLRLDDGQSHDLERFRLILEDPDRQLLLAVDDATDEPLGMAVVVTDGLSELLGTPCTYVSHLVVAARHRRRGAGRALVSAAVTQAERCGTDHVVVGVATDGREAHRFFARLGFAPLVTRRIATVAALRRTLGMTDPAAMDSRTVRRIRTRRIPRPTRGGSRLRRVGNRAG